MQTLIWIAAALAAGFLGWTLYRRFGPSPLTDLNAGRRGSSRLVSTGEFVDGNRHMAVAIAVTDSTFFYENSEMQASLDLEWVREIEYDTDLATGGPVVSGKVMRLRSASQTFEFVLPNETVAAWQTMLPPSRVTADAAAER